MLLLSGILAQDYDDAERKKNKDKPVENYGPDNCKGTKLMTWDDVPKWNCKDWVRLVTFSNDQLFMQHKLRFTKFAFYFLIEIMEMIIFVYDEKF